MSVESIDFVGRMRSAALNLGLTKLAEQPLGGESTEGDEDVQGDDPTSVAVQQDVVQAVTKQNIFQHLDTHPVVLDLLLLRKYGPEWMTWEHETLDLRIRVDFGHSISDLNLHKVQAMKTLHFIDTFWEEWHIFVWCCMALNGVPPDFKVMQVPTVAQCMVAVDIANRVRQDVPFSAEMNDYVEQVHMHDGIFVPIEPLEWVTMDDVEDYPVDCEDVKKRWPEVRKGGKELPSTTVENEQLNRMLSVREYLEESRSSLRAQLPLVTYV
jgi:hypothetical protein